LILINENIQRKAENKFFTKEFTHFLFNYKRRKFLFAEKGFENCINKRSTGINLS
jgi:hypothetical protein